MEDDINFKDIEELEMRARTAESDRVNLSQQMAGLSGMQRDENFLHLQISSDEMLDRLEHFYRGDRQEEDEYGNIIWVSGNKDLKTFNEFGVASMMEVITRYIDKGTILSYYDSTRIYEILADIGDELTLLILCNYQKMGMDNYHKKTKFRIIVTSTLHQIESAYRRALLGKTLMELNQSRVVGQFNNPQMPTPQLSQPKRGWMGRLLNRF